MAEDTGKSTGFRVRPKVVTALALLVLAVVFTLQNTALTSVNFLFWKFSASTALMIFIVLLAGIVSGWFLSSYYRLVRK